MKNYHAMNKRLFLFICLLVTSMACAGERVALWPEGKIPDYQPQQIAATTQEVKAPDFKAADNAMPHLDWYEAPAEKNGGCMLLISGGGYHNCCDGVWIDRVAQNFTKLGFVCVSLTYRTPRPQGLPIYQSAWEDGQRAVRLVRSEAQKRGFDPEKIGVFGFSAGAHLTVLLGTSALTPSYGAVDAVDQLPCHVNWAVP
ncbi:MAG: alpha/beta hydrolase, partial [Verrucomicrobia bacterium]|nr:alpha/beta hydrolase [Verrucomicrobiota bacterium]